jgi:hypothetical protein
MNDRINRMSENIKSVKEDIRTYSKNPDQVKLVTATKYVDASGVLEYLEAGGEYIGENRVQAMREKRDFFVERELEDKLHWHFIGSLQKNKIKYFIDYVELIHSVHSLSLLEAINKFAAKQKKVQDVLLEVNISGEESKHGFSKEELLEEIEKIKELKSIKVKGLMTMAPFTEDEKIIREVFKGLREFQEQLNRDYFAGGLTELSMGMSNDYKIALEEGTTIIRIGSKIFS